MDTVGLLAKVVLLTFLAKLSIFFFLNDCFFQVSHEEPDVVCVDMVVVARPQTNLQTKKRFQALHTFTKGNRWENNKCALNCI